MLRKARADAALAPLVPVVAGSVADGHLRGSYQSYTVDAWPTREKPAPQGGNPPRTPGPYVNILQVKLAGVAGRQFWDCRCQPTLFAGFAVVLGSLAYRLVPTEFRFERPRGGWLAKKMGVPAAGPELEERLRAAGLFETLSTLRWGSNPYLPKVTFSPHGQAIGEGRLAGIDATLKEAVRDQGHPEYESALDEHVRAAMQQHPGVLWAQVEVGKATAPSAEQFRELLDLAVRVAQINNEVNTPGDPAREA